VLNLAFPEIPLALAAGGLATAAPDFDILSMDLILKAVPPIGDEDMDLREEHRRHREFWNRRLSHRAQTERQFRYQYDFYERYRDRLEEPILDVGCGDGEFLEFLMKKGWKDVHGIDISETAVRLTRERLLPHMGGDEEIRVRMGDMAFLSRYYDEGSFRTIVCEGTFHQTTYSGARLTVHEMSRVLSHGGLAYISARSYLPPFENASPVEGERETYRLEEGVVRCYFSRRGFLDLLEDDFTVLELEERELLTRIGKEPYKMWIAVITRR
jgi:SAM-dependent methyltransferase